MFHFIPSGGRIGADHLRYLIDFFERQGLEHTVHDGLIGPEEIEEGHAYISCHLNMDYTLAPVKDRIFQVQLPHNLTGLKGSNLAKSQANLNLLAGRQLALALNINLSDPRYVIRGYVKWDVIYPERHRQKERREEIAAQLGLDPKLPWICFYPTGPSEECRGNQYQSPLIYNHLKKELGEIEFAFCDHANNQSDLEAKRAVKHLKDMASRDPRIHIIDGADTLRHITACNLFITDIASTVVTAISMNKPVVFIAAEHTIRPPERVDNFQCGVFYEQVKDFKEFIRSHEPTRALRKLFERCVQFDDEKNRARIAETIVEKYEAWKKKGRPRARKRLPAGPVRARRIADVRNITWQQSTVTVEDREALLGQRGCVAWLTGLSASGKSTVADRLASRLMAEGHLAYVLDGDNLRHGLNSDLGFSAGDRDENIRRVGEVAALMARAGVIAISAFISPYRAGRDRARATAGENRFIEVFVATPLAECERRDPRGLYKKARSGEIKNFTGIDAPYEEPLEPELILRTRGRQPEECAEEVYQYLKTAGFLTGAAPAGLTSLPTNIAIIVDSQEIFSSHLTPLCEYLDAHRIPYERIAPLDRPSFEEGVVIACVPGSFRRFPDTCFKVMVAHNLTGLKGTKFYTSAADLNVVPGMRNTFRMAESGRSYVLGGYPKWDKIYPMRFKVDEVRQNLRDEYDFPADRKIVAFYPTQSLYHKPGLYQAMDFYDRCRKELGPTEFFVCLHHNFVRSPRKSYDLDFLRSWESAHELVHVVDGADALPIITACHLFVTDTCSTVVTALSMKKPVLFIEMELEGPAPEPAGVYLRQIDIFQSFGVKVDEVDDLDHFIRQGHPGDYTEELFRSCVAYDDDRNCERIMQTIGEQYRLRQETGRRTGKSRNGPGR